MVQTSNYTKEQMTDNEGKKCVRCGEGHYRIATLNDDIFGERHCDKCGHFVKFNQNLEELND